MSYLDRYRQAMETISEPLTAKDGLSAEEIGEGEGRLGISLPEALRAYYFTLGRHALNRAYNRLYAPKEWFIHEGRLVFMEEHQTVLYWGFPIEAAGDDPMVYQGVNLRDNGIEWHCEDARCAEFMLVMMHWQAVCGGFACTGMTRITPANLERIRERWSLVGTLGGGMQAFTQRGDAACVIGEGEEDLELFAASRTEAGYERLDRRLTRMGIILNQN